MNTAKMARRKRIRKTASDRSVISVSLSPEVKEWVAANWGDGSLGQGARNLMEWVYRCGPTSPENLAEVIGRVEGE